MRAVQFRIALSIAVLGLLTILALCLIIVQNLTFREAIRVAAAAHMDAVSAASEGQLKSQIETLSTLVRVLSYDPFLADSDQRSEAGGAVGLFQTALREVPQADSIYVGYDNGCWLQVRRAEDLNAPERQRLQVPAGAAFIVNLVLPIAEGDLPMRRFFYSANGNKIEQIVLWNYGYDARTRDWYHDTSESDQLLVSAPYLSFSLGTPMITLSAPLRGKVKGVVAIDLKLDTYSEFVKRTRPGRHGTTIMFDSSGTLIAHPDFARLVNYSPTHPSENRTPRITDIETPTVSKIIHGWDRSERYEGSVMDGDGNEVLFRLSRLPLSEGRDAYLLLLAAADDFGGNIRDLQIKGTVIAFTVGAFFVPAAWLFGGGMSASLKRITAQAGRLRNLLPPDETPISSRVVEIQQLADTMGLAQYTILSFARFVPRDIVKGILDGSISTKLGGARREVTILFTDVENFTGIAETTDPDVLMQQTSRHFSALTDTFISEGGTVDKFIGDAVMVFWNAPRPQHDHVERACRAALAAAAASDALNVKFEAEGLPAFVVRIGIHVGEAVVGIVGSSERMEYTALGTSVNLASRLEGLNKAYGTRILVSDAVHQRAENAFHFKPIAAVIAKGMTVETPVFELVEQITGVGPETPQSTQMINRPSRR
jgi:adenylate cyclase